MPPSLLSFLDDGLDIFLDKWNLFSSAALNHIRTEIDQLPKCALCVQGGNQAAVEACLQVYERGG